MKIILDTNVVFSALRSKRGASYAILKSVIESDDIITCVSVALLFEYESVLKRTHDQEFIDQFLRSFLDYSQTTIISYQYRPTGTDENDELVLEAAINAAADYIVTHNVKDFSNSEAFGVSIIKPQKFLEILKRRRLR